jgi:hypothetical protein
MQRTSKTVLSLTLAALLSTALGGCAWWRAKTQPAVAAEPATKVELVPFQVGVSSYTVDKLAQQRGCSSRQGAGLVTEKGPVEVYRVRCDNGATFVARCELRQCAALK